MSMAGVLRGAEVGSWPPLKDDSDLVSAISDGVRERRLPTWLQKRSFYLNKEERAQFIPGHPLLKMHVPLTGLARWSYVIHHVA